MNKLSRFIWMFLLSCTFGLSVVQAQIATGGSYTLNQAVIAGGGGTSSDGGNIYRVEGTSGQSAVGANSSGGSYESRSGFWAGTLLAPTAANATVSGRVTGIAGESLRSVTVTLEGGTLFTPRRTRTNAFGYFTFDDVPVGAVYIISVQHKKYGFAQESQIISVLDNVAEIIFQANWEN